MSAAGQTPFGIQLAKSKFHSIASWHRELEIAKALKIAQDDENTDDEAIGLEQLGDVYSERGSTDESLTTFARLDQFILATALYNSSLVRTTHPAKKSELKAKLRQLEDYVVKQCGQNIKGDFQYDVDKDHRQQLEQFRKTCREKLESVQSEFTVFLSPQHDTNATSEARRAKVIGELFIEIQAFVKEFVSGLLDECVQVLDAAPEGVSYAFIGFGSLARGEVTPFSDIESALLVEEGKNTPIVKEYFVKLTEYFNFKVLNLQETILPSMCVPSLNDLNDEMISLKRYKCTATTCTRPDDDPIALRDDSDDDPTSSRDNSSSLLGDRDWFYDDQMRGLSVDGRMSKACKTPLGCRVQGRGRTEDLIKTPTEMAEFYTKYLEADRSSLERKNNDYALSTVLSNVTFFYGNDPSLVDIYDGLVLSMTEVPDGDTKFNARQTSAVSCLRNALEEFQFSLNASDIGLISSIKKKLYRVVDMLVMNLGKFQSPGVVDNSPWNILERLAAAGAISQNGFQNLMVVVGIVNEVRLMSYLRCGRQDELFSFFDQSMDIDFGLAKDLFVRFFYTVFPFQKAVKTFLSGLTEDNAVDNVLFPPNEQFYEYSHLNSAVALSLTSYRFFQETMKKFSEAFQSSDDESTRRLCLAFLSCTHPDYSTQYCDKILESSVGGNNSKWRIFSFLVAALASFHQDNIENVKAFLEAATDESSRARTSDTFARGSYSGTEVVVRSYEVLVRGLLKFRQQRYEEALGEFEAARVLYEAKMQSKGARSSVFVMCCGFMTGKCHMQLGYFEYPSIERVMRNARAYTGNGHYMRILYHVYMVFLQGRERDAGVAKHCEKFLELFLRFRCPKGQVLWSSILAQGVVLGALFLGLLYREMGRLDDALRVFQLASSRVVPKALEFCDQDCHVGKKSAETARMCVDAFRAVFKLLEAECLHDKGCDEEMWSCLTDAVTQLAKYRGKFEPIDLREVFADTLARERSQHAGNADSAVWRTNVESKPLAPRFVDTFSMAYLLEAWCDRLTMAMQYFLYTMERDIYGQILEQGTPLISLLALLSSNLNLLEQFRSNPYQVLHQYIPVLRQNPAAGQMVGQIFAGANAQRKAVFELIRDNVVECQRYAVEFTDDWLELVLLYLRLSLCHDLLSALGLFK